MNTPALSGRSLVRALVSLVADALSPPSCAACDAPVARAVFCPGCAGTVVRAAGGFAARTVAFAVFGGSVAIALRRLKYEGRPDLARPLGQLMRRAAREERLRADVVVPVPLHPRRLAERGYNQAALLAAEVAEELRAPLSPRALVRGRSTLQQALLDRSERLRNVEGAFYALKPGAVRGRSVVLVDDVVTTGATLDACADALFRAEARSVTHLLLAHA